MTRPVISIVGRRHSGKTTLLERLVKELVRRGYRVGTIKHNIHDFEIDYPGKDSYRHFHAGSKSTLLLSDKKLALVKRLNKPLSLNRVVQTFFPGVDLVLTEGFKRAHKPKIEIIRSRISKTPLCRPRGDKLVALVSDNNLPRYQVPQFRLNQIKTMVDFIAAHTCLPLHRQAGAAQMGAAHTGEPRHRREEEFLCPTKRRK